jgi:hypothetical protein
MTSRPPRTFTTQQHVAAARSETLVAKTKREIVHEHPDVQSAAVERWWPNPTATQSDAATPHRVSADDVKLLLTAGAREHNRDGGRTGMDEVKAAVDRAVAAGVTVGHIRDEHGFPVEGLSLPQIFAHVAKGKRFYLANGTLLVITDDPSIPAGTGSLIQHRPARPAALHGRR